MELCRPLLFLCLSLLWLGVDSRGLLSNALGSNMVLQRAPQQARLWGWTKPGTMVIVSYSGPHVERQYTGIAMAAIDGAWHVLLPRTPAGGPYEIVVSSAANETAMLSNVMFGDVYVCSGQSNMMVGVGKDPDYVAQITDALKLKDIRLFRSGIAVPADLMDEPQPEFGNVQLPWNEPHDWNVFGFSAVCWHFGRTIYNYHNGTLPIGLVQNAWATRMEAFVSPEVYAECKSAGWRPCDGDEPMPNMPKEYKCGSASTASQVFNVQFQPLLPMTLRGLAFYKGEAELFYEELFACALPAFLDDLRIKFGNPRGYFHAYVMVLQPWIAPEVDSVALAKLRMSMVASTGHLPWVGWATAIDQGDPLSPLGTIHPRFKRIPGERLGAAALCLGYKADVQCKGPEVTRVTRLEGTPSVRLELAADSIGAGLKLEKNKCTADVPAYDCTGFELRLTDGKGKSRWVPALEALSDCRTGLCHSVTVAVHAPVPSGVNITGARFGYNSWPLCTVYNREGWPLAPFETLAIGDR
eukprot:TRINITY_DN90_c0_g2_i1.p1 TRINITY_DN90_c0_g2~~TRINITY_DN90_c0_g2_i1.p1  ORF type:complete len:525 (+),score=193.81 TRINITY_DN90_c0_g2_i1:145-1719(+)